MTDRIVVKIRHADITPGDNDRKRFEDSEQWGLARNIEKHGQQEPILVRPNPDPHGPPFELVHGERRWRAVGLLKWEYIDGFIEDMSDEQASNAMLIENLLRVNLNPLEEAYAYANRMLRFGYSEPEIAQMFNRSPDLVKRRLALLNLHPDIQPLVASGQLAIGAADAMDGLDHNFQMFKALPYWREKGPSVYAFEAFCQKLLGEQNQATLWSESEMADFMQKPIDVQLDEWGITDEQFESRQALVADNRRLAEENADLRAENATLVAQLTLLTDALEEVTGLLEIQNAQEDSKGRLQ